VDRLLVIASTGEARILVGALGELGYYASIAFGLDEGVERVMAERPDAVAVEVAEPVNGLVLSQARLLCGWTKVVLLGSRAAQPEPGLTTVFWPDDPTSAAAEIKAVLGDAASISVPASRTEQLIADDLTIDPRSTQAYVAGRAVELTAAEFRLLHTLALAEGAPVHRSELSRRAGVADTRVVDVMVRRVRKKLEQAGASTRYIETRVGQGYYFSRTSPE
jgi:hypothetical protein